MAEACRRYTTCFYVIVSIRAQLYVCMDNFKYLRRLKRVEDLIDINKIIVFRLCRFYECH